MLHLQLVPLINSFFLFNYWHMHFISFSNNNNAIDVIPAADPTFAM